MDTTPSLIPPGTKPAAHPIWRHALPWLEPIGALFLYAFLTFVMSGASAPGGF